MATSREALVLCELLMMMRHGVKDPASRFKTQDSLASSLRNAEAWVTLATNDSYWYETAHQVGIILKDIFSLGALVLGASLRRVGTTRDLVVLVTPGVSPTMKITLETVFNLVQEVNVLDSGDRENLAILTRPELGITFTKLHCWKLTQYMKCVFLDADTLVLQNCDELFEREEFSAAPDVGWPDCFNSGVFVYRPSQETFDRLLAFAMEQGSFDGGDQGVLNSFFNDWAIANIARHLPFIYNMVATAVYSYLPAYREFGQNAKIAHFIGPNKPWLQFMDPSTGIVHPPPGQEHLRDLLQNWWGIFRTDVHPKLVPEMRKEESNATVLEQVENLNSQLVTLPAYSFSVQTELEDTIDLDNLNIAIRRHAPVYTHVPPISTHPSPPLQQPWPAPSTKALQEDRQHVHEPFYPIQCSQFQHQESPPNKLENSSSIFPIPLPESACSTPFTQPTPSSPIQSRLQFERDLSKNIDMTTSDDGSVFVLAEPELPSETGTKGLAGVFAKISLEGVKTGEQLEHESLMRKHAWEQGHIDYMGKDSFDNIMKKIQESMAQSNLETKTNEIGKEPSPPKRVEETVDAIVKSEPHAAGVNEVKSESKDTKDMSSSIPIREEANSMEAPSPLGTQPDVEATTVAPIQPLGIQIDEPVVMRTHASEPCICHPPKQSKLAADAPAPTEEELKKSMEELEDEILAAERLALEKKLAEQKRVAEQKLLEEMAAAAKKQELLTGPEAEAVPSHIVKLESGGNKHPDSQVAPQDEIGVLKEKLVEATHVALPALSLGTEGIKPAEQVKQLDTSLLPQDVPKQPDALVPPPKDIVQSSEVVKQPDTPISSPKALKQADTSMPSFEVVKQPDKPLLPLEPVTQPDIPVSSPEALKQPDTLAPSSEVANQSDSSVVLPEAMKQPKAVPPVPEAMKYADTPVASLDAGNEADESATSAEAVRQPDKSVPSLEAVKQQDAQVKLPEAGKQPDAPGTLPEKAQPDALVAIQSESTEKQQKAPTKIAEPELPAASAPKEQVTKSLGATTAAKSPDPKPQAPPRKQASKAWSVVSTISTGLIIAGISAGTMLFFRR